MREFQNFTNWEQPARQEHNLTCGLSHWAERDASSLKVCLVYRMVDHNHLSDPSHGLRNSAFHARSRKIF